MKHLKKNTRFNFLRTVALLLVSTFGITSIIATGGGGDDEGLSEDDIVPRGIYNYRLASGFTATTGGDPLTVNLTHDGQPVTLTVTHPDGATPGIHGTYMTTGGNQVLIEEATAMIIEDVSTVSVISDFRLDVTDFFIFQDYPDVSFPVNGEILITREGDPLPDPVTVTVIDANPLDSVPDVRIIVGMDTSVFTWEEFEAIEDDPVATDEQKFAQFGYESLMFMLELLELSANALETIDDQKNALVSQPVVESCDAFASEGLSAPTGISDVGSVTTTWQDDNSSGGINTGDSFNWILMDCWENDSTDMTDELLNGVIDTAGYIQVINSVGLIETIGFEPNGVDPGGVIFSNFTLHETNSENDPPTLEDTRILNGGFSILFN